MNRNRLEKLLEENVIENKEKYYRLAFSYVKNADDALDIVQESIYKAFSSMGNIENPEYVKTWFYRIVVNTSIDFLRKNKKVTVMEADILEGCIKGMEDNYEDIDLHKAIDTLSPDYKSIITLRYFEDLKIEEVAQILNENINTVKTRLYRALKILKIQMKENS